MSNPKKAWTVKMETALSRIACETCECISAYNVSSIQGLDQDKIERIDRALDYLAGRMVRKCDR